jgi:hypothetical protein
LSNNGTELPTITIPVFEEPYKPPPLLPTPPSPLPELPEFIDNPDTKQLYRLILQLTERVKQTEEKNASLQKEINRLKPMVSTRYKRNVMDYLKCSPPPPQTLKEWLHKIHVGFEQLEVMFENDLMFAIKECILEHLNNKEHVPVKFFKEKPESMFIYDDDAEQPIPKNTLSSHSSPNATEPTEPTDTITTTTEPETTEPTPQTQPRWKSAPRDEFRHLVDNIMYKFIDSFHKWQCQYTIRSTEDKERMISYVSKLMGIGQKAKQEKERHEMQKWFVQQLLVT